MILLAGDGAMTYTLGELATLAQENLNVKIVVLNNSIMGWIKWEQAVYWDGKFQSTDLSPVDFVQVAEGLGCKGIHVSDPIELRDTLAEALSQEAPCLVDARTAKGEAAVAKFTESARAREFMQDPAKTT